MKKTNFCSLPIKSSKRPVRRQEDGPDFIRLANALSALYPKDFEEKQALDAMLLAVPR
jgi:hypothetical protein